VLDILVENTGRINYGPYLTDNRQGITERVTLNGQELTGWKMYSFPFETTAGFKYLPAQNEDELQPVLYRGTFSLRGTGDTYLDMHGYGKGFVFVNGHNLGKYWNIGPQQTLYVPAVWLKKGINEVIVFDELMGNHKDLSTFDHPVLSEVNKN
jgi:beta-galactosidase